MSDKRLQEKLRWKSNDYWSACNRLDKLDKETIEIRKSIEAHNPEKLEQDLNALKSQADNLSKQIKLIPAEEMRDRIEKYRLASEQLEKATNRANCANRDLIILSRTLAETQKFKAGEKKALQEQAVNAAMRADEMKKEMERCQCTAHDAMLGVELLMKLEGTEKKIKDVESKLDYARSGIDQEKLNKIQEEKASLEQQKTSIFLKYKKKRKIKTIVFTIVGAIVLFFLSLLIFVLIIFGI